MCVSFLLYWEVPRFAEIGKGPSLPLEYHWYHLQRMEDSLAARISLITPRSFDPSEPLELQRKLEKRWEVIGKDFAIEKVNQDQNQREAASRSEKVKLVCMSDTHSTQGEFGWSWIETKNVNFSGFPFQMVTFLFTLETSQGKKWNWIRSYKQQIRCIYVDW